MKISLLHYSSPPIVGGVENVIGHHARLLRKASHEVQILAGRGKEFQHDIPVIEMPLLNSRNHDILQVKSELDKGKYTARFDALRDQIARDLIAKLSGSDILIAHNVATLHKNLPLSAALYQSYTLPEFPKLVLWHHDMAWSTSRYGNEMHAGYPWNILSTFWDGARNITISSGRQDELCRLLSVQKENIRVIPNGVDLNSFHKLQDETIHMIDELNLLEADPLFLLPARLTPRKNIELALQIMNELRKIYPQTKLLVTGPEGPHNPTNAQYKQKLIDLRNDLNLNKTVIFMAEIIEGFLPDAVIADLYRLSDALLFPSLEEGFGIPIIEAAFCSKPVFCTSLPILYELGGNDVSYFDVDANPESIASEIQNRLEGEATSRWSRRAKHTYTWEAVFKHYIEPLLLEVKNEDSYPKN